MGASFKRGNPTQSLLRRGGLIRKIVMQLNELF
jgi:hypothetical protein